MQLGNSFNLPLLTWAESDAIGSLFLARGKVEDLVGVLQAIVEGDDNGGVAFTHCSYAVEYAIYTAHSSKRRIVDGDALDEVLLLIQTMVKPLLWYYKHKAAFYRTDPALAVASLADPQKGAGYARELLREGRTKIIKRVAKTVGATPAEVKAQIENPAYQGPLSFLKLDIQGKQLYLQIEQLACSNTPLTIHYDATHTHRWACGNPLCIKLYRQLFLVFAVAYVGNAKCEHVVKCGKGQHPATYGSDMACTVALEATVSDCV
jgi:hypothetical protein